MKILMLGWEYPPHIAGGLGVACEGLTRALAGRGHDLHFVVPRLFGGENASHMRLHDAASVASERAGSIETIRVPAWMLPYGDAPGGLHDAAVRSDQPWTSERGSPGPGPARAHYGPDLFREIERYAAGVVGASESLDFDLIHAHDWMTIPAGLAIKRRTGRPLVLHVHSLEYDRAGEHGNPAVIEIERLGYSRADAIIAVSEYTRRLICERHRVDPRRVFVAHNGIEPKRCQTPKGGGGFDGRPVVLFLGRVTYQKGAEYFIRAAAETLRAVPEAMFVVAGSGDQLGSTVNLAHELGIQDSVLFTGFLRGADVESAYAAATLYVMPSVSEPFGLTALEAVRSGVPCILSAQSGVSEVLRNSLRVDFWDTERLADLMINALGSSALREQLVEMSAQEVTRLRWEASALRVEQVYQTL